MQAGLCRLVKKDTNEVCLGAAIAYAKLGSGLVGVA